MGRFLLFCFSCLLIAPQLFAQSDRWIISPKQPIKSQQQFSTKELDQRGTISLRFPSAVSQGEVEAMLGPENIRFLEPDYQVGAFQSPNDPEFVHQWGLKNIGQLGGSIGADVFATQAWNRETGSDSIVVGILDTGIDWGHPDLIHNIWQNLAEDADGDGTVLEWDGTKWIFDPGDVNNIDDDNNGFVDDFIGWDFVNDDNDPSDDHQSGHGTHVGGIIGAEGNNGIGIAGVAWNVKLMPLKFLDQKGQGYTSDALAAFSYAVQMGAHLTNHSWGSGKASLAFGIAIYLSSFQDHILVAAAGNNFGNDNDIAPLYPASYSNSNVIAVGASTNQDSLARFSNFGQKSVDIFAPGKGMYSTLPGNTYGYRSGTSMAAPMVSGAIALLLSQKGMLSPQSVKTYLFRSATPIPTFAPKSLSGGRLNLSNLLAIGDSLCDVLAYFTIPDERQCDGAPLAIANQSLEATSYQWLFDQVEFDTATDPALVVSGGVGKHSITLIAADGACTDTFEADIFIDPDIQLTDIDTTHCGPSLTLSTPIQSSIYSYTWTDSLGNTISSESEAKILQSGEYQLEVSNVCGDTDQADVMVSLTSGCLWPGDADANGTVNLMDFLTMGLTHGATGPSRTNASSSFISQTAPSWSQSFSSQHTLAPSVNYSHSDADGNGTVQIGADGMIVKANFQGSVEGATSSSSPINVELQFAQSSTQIGDTAFFQIDLKSSDGTPAQNVYGVSMTLSYDLPLSHPIQILPELSWLDDSTGIDTLVIHDQAKRQVHIGITRLNQLGKDGLGPLVSGGVTIMIDDIGMSSIPGALNLLTFSISHVTIIRSDGSLIPLNPSISQATPPLLIHPAPSASQAPISSDIGRNWRVAPNPTNGKIWLYPSENQAESLKIVEIELMTPMGQIVSQSIIKNNPAPAPIHLQLPQLSDGYYLLRIVSETSAETVPVFYRQ